MPRCSSLQRSFLFPIPPAGRTAPPPPAFREAEEHLLTTADGEKVIVWHVPAKPGHAVVLYFHGNGDFLAGLFGRFRDLIADGTGLVALSYRGYAGSSGQPSEQGLLQDAAAAYAFTAARYGADRIVVWGFSLGHRRRGGAGGRAAGRKADPGSALYVDRGCCRRGVSDSCRCAWLMRDPFRSDQRIARVTAPLLIMHGARDPTIPIGFGERLFALAHEPKQFVRFPEGGHNDLDNFGAIETARQFIGASKG